MTQKKLSHIDNKGKAKMVDVGNKIPQQRIAIAEGHICLQKETINLIKENNIKKGDVLTIAEIAGIQAAKKTSDLIPLCHPLLLNKVKVNAVMDDTGVKVLCEVRCIGQTGVEMEALTGTSVALLTIYDMCKAVDKEMNIDYSRLLKKEKIDL